MAVFKRSLFLLAPFAVLLALVATANAAPLTRRQLINLDLGIINAPQDPDNTQNPNGGQNGNGNNPATATDDSTVSAAQDTGRPLIEISLPPILGGGGQNTRTSTTQQRATSAPNQPLPTTTQPTTLPTTTSSSLPVQNTLPPVLPPGQTTETTVVFATQTQELPSSQTPNVLGNTNGATSQKKDNSNRNLIIIIVASIAGGIGAIAIIWTVFRKWKLSPSDQFEERLNPIDWQPTGGMAEHNRSGSIRSNRSYGAAGVANGSPSGSGGSGDSNSTRNLLRDIPAHDFTAGPTGPVGGYADLRRGPSVGSRAQARPGAGYGGY